MNGSSFNIYNSSGVKDEVCMMTKKMVTFVLLAILLGATLSMTSNEVIGTTDPTFLGASGNVTTNGTSIRIDDRSDEEASTGKIFNLRVVIWSDIPMLIVDAIYWFDPTNVSRIGMNNTDGQWINMIAIPDRIPYLMINKRADLSISYFFNITDSSGNSFVSNSSMVELNDTIMPEIVDLTDRNFTTGEPMRFMVKVYDNIVVDSVTLFYRYHENWSSYYRRDVLGRWYMIESQEMTMVSPGTYEILLISRYSYVIEYWFGVSDTKNYIETWGLPVYILDNDPPDMVDLFHERIAHTGELFDFWVRALDNIEAVEALYWSGSQNGTISMTKGMAGYYRGQIPIPSDSIQPFRLNITMVDHNGWTNWTGVITIQVMDNIPPIIEYIKDIMVYRGEDFTLTVNASDNIGVENCTWTGVSLDPVGSVLRGRIEKEGLYHVEIKVFDGSGNHATRSFQIVVKMDNITVSGRVLDTEGQPVMDAKVSVTTADGMTYHTYTEERGTFYMDAKRVIIGWTVSKPGYRTINGNATQMVGNTVVLDLSEYPMVREDGKKPIFWVILIVILLLAIVISIIIYHKKLP